jgi:hypothetical protein
MNPQPFAQLLDNYGELVGASAHRVSHPSW